MSSKPASGVPDKQAKITHPGMMGDGTEEQNLRRSIASHQAAGRGRRFRQQETERQ